jgi:tetraacyldisaccharide-1-P 4'-kinase
LTTEKDLVKLDGAELAPIVAPSLAVEVENADERFRSMLEVVGMR